MSLSSLHAKDTPDSEFVNSNIAEVADTVPVGPATISGAGGEVVSSTTATGADVAVPLPSTVVAVTTTRTVWLTSSNPSLYVCPVCPSMSEHVPPSQRRHWRANVAPSASFHVPSETVSVLPRSAVPVMTGSDVLVGFGKSIV